MPKHVVATLDEIPPGGKKIVEVAGRSIGVFNVGGEFFALRNRCPHQGGPLCLGKLSGFVVSPVPGEYDPEMPLARLGVRHPHRPILVRPRARPRPPVRGHGRAEHRRCGARCPGTRTGTGAVCG
jgi:hypothetical protein